MQAGEGENSLGRVNEQVQRYNKRLKKTSFGVEKFNFCRGLLFNLSCTE